MIFHLLNRGGGRRTLFHKDGDYAAFERLMREALGRVPRAPCSAFCVRFLRSATRNIPQCEAPVARRAGRGEPCRSPVAYAMCPAVTRVSHLSTCDAKLTLGDFCSVDEKSLAQTIYPARSQPS